MPAKTKYYKLSLVLSLLVMAKLLMPVQVLSMQGLPGDEIWLQVNKGDQLIYTYRHSVSKSMVYETYEVSEASSLVLLAIRYSDQGGAGLPDVLPQGATYGIDSGMMVQENLNRQVKSTVFQVDQAYLNTISYRQDYYKLYSLVDANHGRVRVALSYQPWFLTLFNK